MVVWGTWDMVRGGCRRWLIGPLELWVQWVEGELQTCTARGAELRPGIAAEVAKPPPDAEWQRWALSFGHAPRVRLAPVMPDRPVIVRPSSPVQILTGQEACFFVGVPLWVKLSVSDGGAGKDLDICKIPTLLLSNSWFGTPTAGEFCYALRSRARRRLLDLDAVVHRAVCPLVLRNEHDKTLNFERLCLRVRHLAIYRGATHLWASEGRVVYHGEEALSRVTYGEGAPPFDGAARCLTPAQEVPEKGIVAWTFNSLKAFATF